MPVIIRRHILINLKLNPFQKKKKKIIGNKITATYIYIIRAYCSIICECICIGFIDFMFKGKSLTDFTNSFWPSNFKDDDKVF